MDDIMKRIKIAQDLRTQYPEGTKVRLLKMEDQQAPPIGTIGVVDYIDDIATIFVRWANGSHLGVVYKVDMIEKL